jgi:hypothetical protein
MTNQYSEETRKNIYIASVILLPIVIFLQLIGATFDTVRKYNDVEHFVYGWFFTKMHNVIYHFSIHALFFILYYILPRNDYQVMTNGLKMFQSFCINCVVLPMNLVYIFPIIYCDTISLSCYFYEVVTITIFYLISTFGRPCAFQFHLKSAQKTLVSIN